jgi:hypothetical protein
MFKNVASQKAFFYAFDSTTNLPKPGDGGNITAYVSKDYGSVTVLGDTTATEMDSTNGKGYYVFDLTQGETNADTLLFSAKSSTSNIVVVAMPATVFTRPPNFSALSVNSSGQVDVIKLNGTSQTARDIGASVLLSSGTGTGQVSLSSGLVRLSSTGVSDILTTAMTESYNADGAAPTLAQAIFLMIAFMMERSISSTTLTAKKLDGSTSAATFTLSDATNPTSITRAT